MQAQKQLYAMHTVKSEISFFPCTPNILFCILYCILRMLSMHNHSLHFYILDKSHDLAIDNQLTMKLHKILNITFKS